MTTTNWTLVGSHGTVLFYLAMHEDATLREVAGAAQLTERRVLQIVRDLSDADMLSVERRGRRNAYQINRDALFSNPVQDVRLGTVVQLLQDAQAIRPAAEPAPEPSLVTR